MDNKLKYIYISKLLYCTPENNALHQLYLNLKNSHTSVSLLLSRIQGCCYHLSKFHIYALVYCIGVFLSGLLHSV